MEVVGWVEAAIVVTRVGFLDCNRIYKERSQVFEISTRFLVMRDFHPRFNRALTRFRSNLRLKVSYTLRVLEDDRGVI